MDDGCGPDSIVYIKNPITREGFDCSGSLNEPRTIKTPLQNRGVSEWHAPSYPLPSYRLGSSWVCVNIFLGYLVGRPCGRGGVSPI
jgi:hypothetical protein